MTMEEIFKENNIQLSKYNDILYIESGVIGKFLELTNIRTSIAKYNDDEKFYLYLKDKCGIIQKTSCLTEKGIKKLLCLSRKPKAILIANKLGINIDHKYVPSEITFILNIKQAFDGELILTQYPVDKYKVDLYFPKFNIAIEFDEYNIKNTARATVILFIVPFSIRTSTICVEKKRINKVINI